MSFIPVYSRATLISAVEIQNQKWWAWSIGSSEKEKKYHTTEKNVWERRE
jgi:hypothetical protein